MIELLEAERAAIERAVTFPMHHVVTRHCRDHGVDPTTASHHERELKRYLALVATRPLGGPSYPMPARTGGVDDLWHTFLIHTRDYARFCELVADRFLHHAPAADGDEQSDADEQLEAYREFLRRYEEVFQEPAPVTWPRPVRVEMLYG